MRGEEALEAAFDVMDDIPEEAYDDPGDVANMFIWLVQDNGVPMVDAKELVKYKFQTEANSDEEITIDELLERHSGQMKSKQGSQDIEPIKASTLASFEWNPVDAFIEHLKEINDPRVESTSTSTEATRQGEAAHGKAFGLLVSVQPEDTGQDILEKMKSERVTAINHGDYQLQGAPDTVVVDGDSVRVEDLKTTSWDDRGYWERHQLPSAAFQVRIYSWMLSHVPDVTVENPRITVKQRDGDGELTEWFTHEVEYDREETEDAIDHALSMLEQPTELAPLRPDEDWKNNHWDEFIQLAISDDGQQTLGEY